MKNERDMTDLAALIEADLRVSGAQTQDEMKAALAASLLSLMRPAEVTVVPSSEAEKRSRLLSVRLTLPRLPGSDRSEG